MDENSIQQEIKELVCYIWDNCLELLEDTQIFVMGVGFAYLSIKMLLLNRSKLCAPRRDCVEEDRVDMLKQTNTKGLKIAKRGWPVSLVSSTAT